MDTFIGEIVDTFIGEIVDTFIGEIVDTFIGEIVGIVLGDFVWLVVVNSYQGLLKSFDICDFSSKNSKFKAIFRD